MDCDSLECYAKVFERQMYTACKEGDWESNGIFEGNNYNNFQKDSVRKSKLISY